MKHVFLIGFMGAGKTTVGRKLAARLGRPFLDLDDAITSVQGRSVAEIFAAEGESCFRDLELEALEALRGIEASVVACGGGVVTTEGARTLLRELGTVVYLQTTAAETIARIQDTSSRPLLARPDAAEEAERLLGERRSLYEAVAQIQVDTVGATPSAIAEKIAASLEEAGVA